MKANYKSETVGKGLFIAVVNFHCLNEVCNYCYSNLEYIIKHKKDTVGMWKPKKLKQ